MTNPMTPFTIPDYLKYSTSLSIFAKWRHISFGVGGVDVGGVVGGVGVGVGGAGGVGGVVGGAGVVDIGVVGGVGVGVSGDALESASSVAITPITTPSVTSLRRRRRRCCAWHASVGGVGHGDGGGVY